nr:MAG TPA: portal [Caudoviricetes sp.]
MALSKVTESLLDKIIQKQASQTSRDMRSWRDAKKEATKPEFPRRTRLVDLVDDMLYDLHLSSQMELRRDRSLNKPFVITNQAGKIDLDTTQRLNGSIAFGELLTVLLETPFWGHSLVEISPAEGDLFTVSLIPRRHVVPALGLLLPDVSDTKGIDYRADPRYGTSIIEVGNPHDLGILYDCCPNTIFKRYALSAWSEFTETFGIPPRTLKIDTDDQEALARAEEMMTRMGRANWAIIDSNEEMSFATGVSGNGDIFDRLISACKADISVKICGCVIGQDTQNGNYSKEESSLKLLDAKCSTDRSIVTKIINSTVLPALSALGYINKDLHFAYPEEEDKTALWQRTRDILPYYEVDEAWIVDKFGISVTGKRSALTESAPQLSARQDPFFG